MTTAEMTDTEVFGQQQGELSDEEVFGRPQEPVEAVDTDSFGPPQAWLDRVRNGQVLKRVTDRAMSGAQEGLGTEPLGISDEHYRQLVDLGIFRNPWTGRPGYAGVLGEAAIDAVANGLDSIMRGVSAGVHGAGGAFGQIVDEISGSETQGIKAEREAINLANMLLVESGMGRYARPNISRDNIIHSQPIGGLPTEADFRNAATAIAPQRLTTPVRAEEDLRRLWWERGVLPSEAVRDTEFAALAKEPVGFIVWHGSGANFDAFDFSKIGTGEGAQAYGHGGYFGEARSVGEEYRDVVSRQHAPPLASHEQLAKDRLFSVDGDRGKAIEGLRADARYEGAFGSEEQAREFKKAVDLLESGWTEPPPPKGYLYRVRINADPEQFIDYDKTLSEQPDLVKDVISNLRETYPRFDEKLKQTDHPSNPDINEVIASLELAVGPKESARILNDSGIPGIKYLDQGSRLQGLKWEIVGNFDGTYELFEHQGPKGDVSVGKFSSRAEADAARDKRIEDNPETRNYVVFDDKAVQITHKNDVPMENLRELWQERGIHPAEAAHDAGQDAFLRDEIANPTGAHVPLPEREKIATAAVRLKGKVYTGAIHSDALENAAAELGDSIWGDYKEENAGFVTTTGRFVDRQEANRIVHGGDIYTENVDNLPDWKRQEIEYLRRRGLDAQDLPSVEEQIGLPASVGADVTRPENLPTLEQQPPPPPGSLVAALQATKEKLFDIGRDIQMMLTPMAAGSRDAMALAKDFANAIRRNRWEWNRVDRDIANRFTPEQRKRMWDAADEESVARQLGESTEHQGLVTLEPAERAAVDDLQTRAQLAWGHARDLGMVEGEGLPAYTPRMVLNVAEAGGDQRALPLNSIGRNLTTRTSQMLHREHMMAEETEAAAREKVRAAMTAAGKSEEEIAAALENVKIARDIRSLPLATAKLEDAIAGRTLVNAIQDAGRATGDDTVSIGANPGKGWFTIDHPALYQWRPKMKDGTVVKDADGNTVFERQPIYIRDDFEGPLRAVLTKPSGATYQALMSLKGKTMGLIMNSPIIHNAVEWGRALPAMPGKVATFRIYFQGNAAKRGLPYEGAIQHVWDWATGRQIEARNAPPDMVEAVNAGLVPIGHRFFNQDISSIMEEPNLAPGRSWTAQVLGFVPGLFDPEAGVAVKAAIDKAGDFWHNTLLWDRVGDLQMGLYVNMRDGLLQKGVDRLTASRAAAHWANRYAGALPKEAMSDGAAKIANLLLFSRSFTLGNIGAMKDMLTGLPRDVMAQIERDGGMLDPKAVRSIAVRKAIAIVTLDMGLMYIGNSILQNTMNVLTQDSTLDAEMHGYAQRMADELRAVKEHPLKLLQPLSVIGSLSATSENEPGRDERIRVGYASDGTAIYARNPAGKIGEEFTGYLTGPLDMIRKKLSPVGRAAWGLLANDKGFGRKVYDPSADVPSEYLGNMGAIAEFLAGTQVPVQQIGAFADLVKGEGDAKVNALQLFGPLAGVTFSKGAPGGPAIGELYHARDKHDYAVQAQLPDIRKQIQRGDVQGARDRMTELGIPAGLQRYYIRTTQDPRLRLSPKVLRDFYQYGTPEQKERMERLR